MISLFLLLPPFCRLARACNGVASLASVCEGLGLRRMPDRLRFNPTPSA